MTCEDALALLSGHLDGENTQEEEQALLAHLQVCDACRALFSAFEEADAGVLALRAEPPQGLREQIMEQVRREPMRPKRHLAPWAVPAAAAAAVVALLVGTGLLSQPLIQFTADVANTNAALETRVQMTTDTTAETASAPEVSAFDAEMMEPVTAQNKSAADAAEEAQPETDAADTADSTTTAAADSSSDAQEIAQARQAEVIVLSSMEPDFSGYTKEYLEDGAVLVTLEDAAALERLQTTYPDAPVFGPASGQAEQFFAMVPEP